MKNSIPHKHENPNGFHRRYLIQKIIGVKRVGSFRREQLILEQPDKGAEYFIMRLDEGGKDKKHIEACRKAVLYYASLIRDHLPELSKDLIKRYSN